MFKSICALIVMLAVGSLVVYGVTHHSPVVIAGTSIGLMIIAMALIYFAAVSYAVFAVIVGVVILVTVVTVIPTVIPFAAAAAVKGAVAAANFTLWTAAVESRSKAVYFFAAVHVVVMGLAIYLM